MTTPDPQYPPPLPYIDRACAHGYNPQACTRCADESEARSDKVRFHYWETAEPKEGYWVRPSAPLDDAEFVSRTVRGWDYGSAVRRAPTREEAKVRGFGSKPGHISLGHFLSFARGKYPGTALTVEEAKRLHEAWRAQFRGNPVVARVRDSDGSERPLDVGHLREGDMVGCTPDGRLVAMNPRAVASAPDADGNPHAVGPEMCTACDRPKFEHTLWRGGCYIWLGCQGAAARAGIKPGT